MARGCFIKKGGVGEADRYVLGGQFEVRKRGGELNSGQTGGEHTGCLGPPLFFSRWGMLSKFDGCEKALVT